MNKPFTPFPPAALDTTTTHQIIDGLAQNGFAVVKHAIPTTLCRHLFKECESLRDQQALSQAGIGRGRHYQQRDDIRNDAIHWLDGSSQAQRAYFGLIDTLRMEINRALFLGLFELEAHFALYAPGHFYKCHLDSLEGRSNRCVSSVLYLNEEWPQDGGGEMALYPQSRHLPAPGTAPVARVTPEMGTLACFLSEQVPHEVLPTRLPRMSIAGWFRRNASVQGVIDPAH